ncbi:acyl-CoA dehydrogenase/oxidase [Pyronema omphalodes]|nr:acyl-CoA dehydrogenase/oxidase [Pyronema omphalodes]
MFRSSALRSFVASRPLTGYLRCKAPLNEPPRRQFSSVMDTTNFTETQLDVREAISKICSRFPDEYWAERDETQEYPGELHAALAKDGWIGICLAAEYGGAGLGISEATMMLHTISESGAGMAGAQSLHANIYATQPVSKFASDEQKAQWIPPLILGKSRTCFGVTEPNTGLETLALQTKAVRDGDHYSITGSKIWITNAQIADTMVLLARTSESSASMKPSQCLSLFYIPFDKTQPGLDLRKIKKMGGRAVDANEVFFDSYRIPASSLIGKEGDGFKMVLHGMNAERCLLAGEALGLGYAALNKATKYAKERVVFGSPIGKNQSIQHGLAECYMNLEAAKLATYHAAKLYDAVAAGKSDVGTKAVGAAANSAKYLAAEAAYKACERAVLTLGGMGYAQEYHVERYLRECLVPRIAPVSREMILNFVGEKVLGLPKSY